jgi:hypothetical protein
LKGYVWRMETVSPIVAELLSWSDNLDHLCPECGSRLLRARQIDGMEFQFCEAGCRNGDGYPLSSNGRPPRVSLRARLTPRPLRRSRFDLEEVE